MPNTIEEYVPHFIKQTIQKTPRQTVTAERFNELFNLLITQGDYNADIIGILCERILIAEADILNVSVGGIPEDAIDDSLLSSHQDDILARFAAHADAASPHSGHSTIDDINTAISNHNALYSVHGGVVGATPGRLILRDVHGRAKVIAPSDPYDIVNKSYADSHINSMSVHGAVSDLTASRIIIRDSSGRARVASPSHANDIATKGYADSVSGTPADGSVTEDKLATGAVTNSKIANLAVTVTKMAANAIRQAEIRTYTSSASGTIAAGIGNAVPINMHDYSFNNSIYAGSAYVVVAASGVSTANTVARMRLWNQAASASFSYTVRWRYIA